MYLAALFIITKLFKNSPGNNNELVKYSYNRIAEREMYKLYIKY